MQKEKEKLGSLMASCSHRGTLVHHVTPASILGQGRVYLGLWLLGLVHFVQVDRVGTSSPGTGTVHSGRKRFLKYGKYRAYAIST